MVIIWLALSLVWIASGVFEFVAAGRVGRRAPAKTPAILAVLASALATGGLMGLAVNLLSVLFLIIAVYRALSVARIFKNRLEYRRLARVSRASFWPLVLAQLVILMLAIWWPEINDKYLLMALMLAQLIVALTFLANYRRQLELTEWKPAKINLAEHELPTLTVAIPAKNETSELEACLTSLLASDYPKLEVLVLDDAAGNKTGEIINGLAHDGVRFILGEQSSGNWLAKNLAYERLAAEANGEIILFSGVDVRFSSGTLRLLVNKIIKENLDMISLMPTNTQRARIIQPMRYFFELARPRLGSSAPVLSTCWAIQKAKLRSLGGFDAVRQEMIPERYFAAACTRAGKYRFLRAGNGLNLTSEKTAAEQRRTAIRTRYPLLHRRLTSVAGTSLFSLAFLLGPLIVVILLPLTDWTIIGEIAGLLALACYLSIYGDLLVRQFNEKKWLAPYFLAAVISDIILANLSALKYEFGRVIWKGRDVAR